MATGVPAGWYTNEAGVKRYWDGSQWWSPTDTAAVAPTPTVDAPVASPEPNASRTRPIDPSDVPADADLEANADDDASEDGGDSVDELVTPTVVGLALGIKSSAVVLSDGTVRAWGSNEMGALDVPQGLSGVEKLVAGNGRTYAVTAPAARRREEAPQRARSATCVARPSRRVTATPRSRRCGSR